ncbi:MAG: MaoC family dehydratase N-terminal domain-containing protein [Candidatus Lambdaproteobacteria bacterium]|nr:MaoC family dehydratase N-terminal domain-containing protein [Candidatus Lambdaproteobacteria bacterium]
MSTTETKLAEQELEIRAEAEEGKITEEALAAVRAMIGIKLRPEQYLRDATPDTIVNFSNGIGDLNPLYRNLEYVRWTRVGGLIAHPLFPLVHHWPGRSYWGLPGVHGFAVGNDWEFFRNIRPGDRINCWNRVVDIQEKASRFSGRLVLQFAETTYVNLRDEIVAQALGWTTRHERSASREKGKYKEIVSYEYSPEEMREIDLKALMEEEQIRGAQTRYWEDVEEGEELPEIVRGPLSLSDTMGFIAACGRARTHGVLLKEAVKHPKHYIRNLQAGGGIEYTGIGHHREDFARQVGVPGLYDYLPQRVAWMGSLVTNWMGDDAVLKRLRVEARRFNVQGDTQFCRGRVTRRYKKDGFALVDLHLEAVNQRGETTTPGLATVILPSKDIHTRPITDGAALSLDLPVVR